MLTISMVRFAESINDGDRFFTCPACILGFFCYETGGIPTPELINIGTSVHDIERDCLTDKTEYAVVHTASWLDLTKKFVVPFSLGDPKQCVFIIPLANITDPLFVFTDYGNEGAHHFCTLPNREWGHNLHMNLM